MADSPQTSTTSTGGAVAAGIRAPIGRAEWIQSPGFDTFLLIFAPLVTLPIIAGVYWRVPLLAIGGGMTLAFAHYGSSLSFYLWDENRQYHRTRWLAFFAGPVILTMVYLLLLGFQVPFVIQFILFFWNTWHVARQNCGILSLYRSRDSAIGCDGWRLCGFGHANLSEKPPVGPSRRTRAVPVPTQPACRRNAGRDVKGR